MEVVIVEGNGQFWGEFGRSIVTSGDFATRLLPNNVGQDLYFVSIVSEALII